MRESNEKGKRRVTEEGKIMKKVMLVEDEELILQGIRNIIDWEELGLQVVHMAHHGVEAYEMWQKNPVDIIVTDLEMPVMGGLELLRKIRKENDRVRFIILTGYDEFAYAREAIRLEVENYLLKPIDEDALVEQLQETMRKLDETDRARHQYAEEKNDWLHFLSGKSSREEEEKFVSLLNSSIDKPVSYAAIMKLNLESMKETKVSDVLVQLRQEEEKLTVIHLDLGSFLVVWSGEERKPEEALEYFSGLQNRIESSLGVHTFITLGQPCYSFHDLPNCYKTAKKLQKYLLIEGYGNCLDETRIQTHKTKDIAVDSVYLRKLVLKKDKKGVMDYLSDLFVNNLGEVPKVDVLFQVAVKIAMILQEIKEEYKLENSGHMKALTELIENIFQAETIFGLKAIFTSEIDEIINALHEEDSHYTPVIKQIIHEVQKNYWEDMNLKTLSYKYHMNASYLGQIFQKEVGVSFANYLSNTKMSVAKDLILNTNKKINDIAREVGYPDTSYFYRKFKQCYGVSPASLREMKKY